MIWRAHATISVALGRAAIRRTSVYFSLRPPAGPPAARHARSVQGIWIMHQLARVLVAASCANEYLDFDIEGRINWVNTVEEQLTAAMGTVHGWQRLNEIAHVLPPSFDTRRKG